MYRGLYMNKEKLFSAACICMPFLMLSLTTMPNVYAGGPRLDYDERYSGVPGAPDCWVDGWDYGTAHIYDKTRAEICKDIPGDQFNAAWDHACQNQYSPDSCENIKSYTDANVDPELIYNSILGKCWVSGASDGETGVVYDTEMAGSNVCGEYRGMYDNGWDNACELVNTTKTCEVLKQKLIDERSQPGSPSPP